MSTELKRIDRWLDWPLDVVETLRKWNTARTLSFFGRKPFVCYGCAVAVDGNPYGNAVCHGQEVCDACLIHAAREFSDES